MEGKKKPLKFHEMKILGLGWPTIDFTDSGLPSVDNAVLKDLAGPNPSKGEHGKIFEYYKYPLTIEIHCTVLKKKNIYIFSGGKKKRRKGS